MGTRLKFSTTFHPQTDGQTERVNQVVEDMLRMCIIDFGNGWDKYMALVEFTYNNSYQASIKMSPYEALYGKPCRTPLNWDEVGERKMIGLDIVQEIVDKVKLIKGRLLIAQSSQKSYANERR